MIHRCVTRFAWIGLLVAVSPLAAGPADWSWLEGTWKRETSGGTAYESWRALSERTLEGRGWRRGPDGGERETESILLARMGDEWFYIPRPAGNERPVAFKLVERSETEAVFENATHDFPQRIGYRLDGDGKLTAWIEGKDEAGESRRIDFAFERAGRASGDEAR